MNNFEYAQAGMEEAISDLTAAKTKASESFEEIKAELRDNLLSAGMSGSTADVLLETFEKEVTEPAENYLVNAEHFIDQNTRVKSEMDNNSSTNISIASM